MHPLYSSAGNLGKLLGPLPMHPAAEDNYGYDACAVLCLPCIPNILVIATESGVLYHCVVLDAEEDEEQVCRLVTYVNVFLSSVKVPAFKMAECLDGNASAKAAFFYNEAVSPPVPASACDPPVLLL